MAIAGADNFVLPLSEGSCRAESGIELCVLLVAHALAVAKSPSR